MRARWFGGIIAAAALVTLSACGSSSTTEGPGGVPLVNAGQLTVCSDLPYPPFDIQKGSTYTGFDLDLMEQIAKGIGVKMQVQDTGFDALQSGLTLNAGQCDIAASAMTITADREKNLDFSKPYYNSQQSLLVPDGSDIKSIDDLVGKKVGVQQGTTGESYTEENAPKGAQIVSFPSDGEMYQAIKAGQVDALLQDLPVNLVHQQDGGFTIVEQYSTGEQYGFAVKQGNTELLNAVNEQLSKLRSNGTYDKLYNKYFQAG
jgi:polar amino acid transport system substrate-binding protein